MLKLHETVHKIKHDQVFAVTQTGYALLVDSVNSYGTVVMKKTSSSETQCELYTRLPVQYTYWHWE